MFKRLFFISIFVSFFTVISYFIFSPIFLSDNIVINYGVNPFNICAQYPIFWQYLKLEFMISLILGLTLYSNCFYNIILRIVNFLSSLKPKANVSFSSHFINNSELNLFIGTNSSGEKIYIGEKGLCQNFLITGTIGSGKTSSAMYPFTRQLIQYKCNSFANKLGMLVLDVKGVFHFEVTKYCELFNRLDDLIILKVGGNFKYNPLDKPNLKPHVLANRLKIILTLFSKNNTESYWLDKAEQIITEAIKLCRLYNDGYVTFLELHRLITVPNYYIKKIEILRTRFQAGDFSHSEVYDLLSAIRFFEEEFRNLDSRTLAILKSEITRITGNFVNDFEVLNTFCPNKQDLNFNGFYDVINSGKIVVLDMNIAEYSILSKIIATYLKLDFQSEIMAGLSKGLTVDRFCAFVCDEFQEYVTSTDAEFFAQSREAKCINIVATQSYSSLKNSLGSDVTSKVIVQNLINKLWFRTDDIWTIEDIQKQIGKEDKEKFSKSITENAKETKFSYLTSRFNSKNSSISESINSYFHSDFIYDTKFFTQELEAFSCIAFLSDGKRILKPAKLILQPYFKFF